MKPREELFNHDARMREIDIGRIFFRMIALKIWKIWTDELASENFVLFHFHFRCCLCFCNGVVEVRADLVGGVEDPMY